MPFRYAPLPNHTSTQDRELEASFDGEDSDVEENDIDAQPESHLLNPSLSRSPPPTATPGSTSYNFEDLDYAYPPPGRCYSSHVSIKYADTLQAPLRSHLALHYRTM